MQSVVQPQKRSHRFIDLTGQRIGRIVVVKLSDFKKGKHLYWRCQCDCGKVKDIAATSLQSKSTKSCGCLVFENQCNLQHGLTGSREWKTWRDMKRRCSNPRREDYHLYGGRGIKVCDRWRSDFPQFLKDMGKRPEGKSIGRIDNNGDYEPENCRWETMTEQANNRRGNIILEYRGERMTCSRWATRLGMEAKTIRARIYRGFNTIEEILFGRVA